jgi:hypothetical protein
MHKPRRIKTKFSEPTYGGELAGWLQGKHTYLWFGEKTKCLGILSGGKLLRLAKAIVKEMEGAK